MPEIVVRTLSREVRIAIDSAEAYAAVSYAAATPEMPGRELRRLDLAVRGEGPFYRFVRPGAVDVEGTAEGILYPLGRFLLALVEPETAGLPVLHAGLAEINGARVAFLAGKADGKTTLMLRLIREGFLAEGDENIVLGGDGAIARPRTLHVKEGSLPFFPEFAAVIAASPFTTDWSGNRIYAVPPTLGGRAWRLEAGPLRHLVFIEANHGGSSILSRLGRDQAFARLLETAIMPRTDRGAAAARLRTVATEAQSWRLSLGKLDQAVWHLRRIDL